MPDGKSAKLNMPPSSLLQDVGYRCSRDTKFFSERLLAYLAVLIAAANFAHLFYCQSVKVVPFSFGFICAPFSGHVGHVIYPRAEKEMVDIAARRIIASVANLKFVVFNWAICEFKRHTMSGGVFTTADVNKCVRSGFKAHPDGTSVSVRFAEMRGQSNGNRDSSIRLGAKSRAKTTVADFKVGMMRLKRLTAMLAVALSGFSCTAEAQQRAESTIAAPDQAVSGLKFFAAIFAITESCATMLGSHRSLLNRFLGQARRCVISTSPGRFDFNRIVYSFGG